MGQPAPLGVGASGLPPAGDKANAVVTGQITAVGPTAPFAFLGPINVSIWASLGVTLTTTAGSLSASVGSGTGVNKGQAVNSVNVPRGTTWGAFSGTSGTLAIPPITLTGNIAASEPQITNLASTDGLVGAAVTGPYIPAGTTVTSITTAAVAATNDNPGVLGTVTLSANPTTTPVQPARLPFVFARTGNAITVSGADANATLTGGLVAGTQVISFVATIQIERSFDGGQTWLPCNIGGNGVLAQYTAGTPVSLTFGEPEREVLYRLNCLAYTSGTINYRFSENGGAAMSLSFGTPI